MAAPNVIHWDNARYFGPKAPNVKYLIWHCTAGATALSSVEWMNRKDLPPEKRASYTYLIERDGTIYRHTPLDRTAFHAGKSQWPVPAGGVQAGKSLNGTSLGIAFANRNDGEPLTPAQIASAEWLALVLMKKFNVPPANNLGHREVSPMRKIDPLPKTLNMPKWRERLGYLWEYGV